MTITPSARLTILVVNSLATVVCLLVDLPWLAGLLMIGVGMDYLEFRRDWRPPAATAEEKGSPYQRYSAWTIGLTICVGMVNGSAWQKVMFPGSSALIYSAGVIMLGLTIYAMSHHASASAAANASQVWSVPGHSLLDRFRQFSIGVTLGASQYKFVATHLPGHALHYWYALLVFIALVLIGDVLSSRRR